MNGLIGIYAETTDFFHKNALILIMSITIVCLRQSGTDWRADGYRWRQNGTTAIPKQKPVIRKIHFDNIISTGGNKSFRKFVYSNADEEKPQYVVVQYVGDASTVANFPHGKKQLVVDPGVSGGVYKTRF